MTLLRHVVKLDESEGRTATMEMMVG